MLSLGVVAPIFLTMATGYFLKRINLFDQPFIDRANMLSFKVFLPVYMFQSIYNTDLNQAFSPRLIGYSILCMLVLIGVLCILTPIFEHDGRRIGVIVQACFRTNFILFGIPVTASILGEENVGVTAMLVSIMVPFFNVMAVVVLEGYAGSGGLKKLPQTLLHICKNPLIWAGILGILCITIGIKFPSPIESTLSYIGRIATPLGLLALGGDFKFSAVHHNLKTLLSIVVVRLMIVPAIFLPLSVFFGFKGAELIALLALFASPTALSSYVMAAGAGADGELAGQSVVFTSLFFTFTMFTIVLIMKQLALI